MEGGGWRFSSCYCCCCCCCYSLSPCCDQCSCSCNDLRTAGAPRGESQLTSSCLVLECPEYEELTSLHRDEAYDYYSLYTDPMRECDRD